MSELSGHLRRAMWRRAVCLFALTMVPAIVVACAGDGRSSSANGVEPLGAEWAMSEHVRVVTSNDGAYRVSWMSTPTTIPLNEEFTIEVQIRPEREDGPDPADLTLTVDASMPEHRHGMIQRPFISLDENGRFVVEGMLFHMPGYWQLYFDVTHRGVTERAQADVTLD